MTTDLAVERAGHHVVLVVIRRGRDGYLDLPMLHALGACFDDLDRDPGCRAIVLAAEGRNFCAGVRFGEDETGGRGMNAALYDAGLRLFDRATPVVAAVGGAAIGGGLGLALSCDLRVAEPTSTFAAPFVRLGLHHGFGLSVTLPDLVGPQRALDMLVTGRRVRGEEAFRLGICDRLAPAGAVREAALELAEEVATAAPLAVARVRATLRHDRSARLRSAIDREIAEQDALRDSEDCAEGLRALAERRPPAFAGR